MYKNEIKAYERTSYETADPKKIVLMCYEGAIIGLRAAKEHYVLREYEAKAKSLAKTYDMIHVLLQALDLEQGGNIATKLDALYRYMIKRILEGDLKSDLNAFDEIIHMLEELESAWKEIFLQNKRENDVVPFPHIVSGALQSTAAMTGGRKWSV